MRRAAATGATVLPVDSEHNAIFQALGAGPRDDVKPGNSHRIGRAISYLDCGRDQSRDARTGLASSELDHGAEITVDSATMMNKGLELIEAHHLFALPPEEIDVLVHPQSVVHGLVEFRDGSVVAQLGSPDMRIPIAHCLAWPRRIDGPAQRLDLAKVKDFTFEAPDAVRFPALALARQALKRAARRRPSSMRPTKSLSPNSLPAALALRVFRHWSKRRWKKLNHGVLWPIWPQSRPLSPLTILQEV